MDNLRRLIAVLFLLTLSPFTRAACIQAEGATVCDSQSEAQAYLISNSEINDGASGPFARLVPYTPYPYISNSPPHDGREVFGRYQCYQTLNGVDYNCYTSPNAGVWWWGGAVPDACGEAVGGSGYSLRTSPTWPPSGIGCSSYGGENCATIVDVVSSPSASNGPDGTVYTYGAQHTFTGSACPTGEEPDQDVVDTPPDPDGWRCDPATGTCLDPENNPNTCTFNPDGSRSACVRTPPAPDPTDPPPTPDPDPTDPNDNRNASGGGSCNAAPACGGDPIDCAQLWQQWKTRCAIEVPENATGRSCSNGVATSLNCSNMDPARCLELQVATEAACSLAKIAANDGEGGDDGGVDTDGMGDPNDFGDSGISAADAWMPDGEGPGGNGSSSFDTSGFLSGRSCPVMPVVDVMGTTIDFNFPQLCWFMGIGANLVLLFAALASIKIVSRVI